MAAGERPTVVPLSFAQSRLWFIDQFQGPSSVYNMAVALRLRGRLDADALGAALADVVGCHESLRTLFSAHEGIPWQLVVARERADFGWAVVDATGWPESRLGEAIDAVASHPFDLATEIPLQARLFRVGDDEHVLVAGCTTSPRMVCRSPRWCGISRRPMPAGRAGQVPDWAPLPVQYVDYTLWQRAQLGDIGDSRQPHRRPAGSLGTRPWPACPSAWQLPTDRPYPPGCRLTRRHCGGGLAGELQQQVARVAREHNATSFMVIQAALAVLLSRLSASSDVAVGFPIAGRRDPALDALVGFFVNTLVLRVDLAGDPTIAELLAQVRARSLAAYEHQDVPFEVLVERLNPTRTLTHHPLVQVMLDWQNWRRSSDPVAGLTLGDLELTALPLDTRTARRIWRFRWANPGPRPASPPGSAGRWNFAPTCSTRPASKP